MKFSEGLASFLSALAQYPGYQERATTGRAPLLVNLVSLGSYPKSLFAKPNSVEHPNQWESLSNHTADRTSIVVGSFVLLINSEILIASSNSVTLYIVSASAKFIDNQ